MENTQDSDSIDINFYFNCEKCKNKWKSKDKNDDCYLCGEFYEFDDVKDH